MAENKKDSFTFSDKIKNSKPALNPFAKRASKIGSNGKPKKTIFERTRRDIPFFIAAAAALLFLPFLYKYSGSVVDEPVVTPGYASEFDPDRDGLIPGLEDPGSHIAQYTGRDSISLIKPFGADDESSRDGVDDEMPSYVPSYSSSSRADDTDYRRTAPAATRAAFRKTTPAKPTAIKELGSASMARGNGGGLMYKFGGANLKKAANANSAGAPKQGAKPVSLQPLRAAGNPSRSYFGQGVASQARAARDAMGKANAQEALRDAVFKPVEAGKLGGLGEGGWSGGGGAGKWDNKMEYQAMKPWWWDEMQAREHAKWEWKYFLWRKGLVEPLIKALAETLATFGKGFACCLLTGDDGCEMGTMWGAKAGDGQEAKCGELNEEGWNACSECLKYGKFGKSTCKAYLSSLSQDSSAVKKGWVGSKAAPSDLNFFQVRANCMGATFKGKDGASLSDRYSCELFAKGRPAFDMQVGGKASSWHKYIIVTAKNMKFSDGTYLCIGLDKTPGRTTGGFGQDGTNNTRAGREERFEKSDRKDRLSTEDTCVIYIQEGTLFNWSDFRHKLIETIKPSVRDDETAAEKVFNSLRLDFVQGLAMNKPLTSRSGDRKWWTFWLSRKNAKSSDGEGVHGRPVDFPMLYNDFLSYYVHRQGTKTEKETGLDNKKYKKSEGKDRSAYIIGTVDGNGLCQFSSFRIDAVAIDHPYGIEGDLSFEPQVHGVTGGAINVTLTIPETKGAVSNMKVTKKSTGTAAGVARYTAEFTDAQKDAIMNALSGETHQITAQWKATFNTKVSEDEATYEGDEPAVPYVPPSKPDCDENSAPISAGTDGDGCELVKKCVNGAWGQPEKKDPTCASSTPQLYTNVGFLSRVQNITKNKGTDPAVRGKENTNTEEKTFAGCTLDNIDVNKLLALPNMDKDVKQMLKDAAAYYNDKNKDVSTLTYDEKEITVANLLDAMSLINEKENGNGQIPLNAVCILGKTIGASARWSKSNLAATMDENGNVTLPKAGNVFMNNMFGAFAAYMGDDSSFYPALRMKVGSVKVDDPRFSYCQAHRGSAENGYWYGHYNWNFHTLGDLASDASAPQDDRKPYAGSSGTLKTGRWGRAGYPLKPIADAVSFTRKNYEGYFPGRNLRVHKTNYPTDVVDIHNRKAYIEKYKNVLFSEQPCGLPSKKMSYDKVKAYIGALCENGALQDAPKNGSSFKCGSKYQLDKVN